MRSSQLTEEYFHWLVLQVEIERSDRDYEDVLQMMHETEFVWFILGDDNRLMDGLALRGEFLRGGPAFEELSTMPCSVLEVMIGLSRRMAFTVGGTAEGWAWQFMLNLGFERYSDPLTKFKRGKVEEILQNLVYLNYNPDGSGGFFPLQDPDEDMTKVEIWYQMSAYIDEILPD